MPNLVKFNSFVVKNDDKIIIDSNKLANELLEQQRRNFAKKAQQPDEDGFVCGLDAATVEELVMDEPVISEEQMQKADEVIADARQEADRILAKARKEAEEIAERAREEGYNTGFEQGTRDADIFLADKQNALENEYQSRRSALEDEYRNRFDELEPELVNAILEVVENIFGVISTDSREIVLSLVNSVMRNTELSKQFTIRVSDEDYDFLNANRNAIYGATSSDITIEITKDNRLEHNQCVIETDAGVFDCSLDIQLRNLIHEIKVLSCMH